MNKSVMYLAGMAFLFAGNAPAETPDEPPATAKTTLGKPAINDAQIDSALEQYERYAPSAGPLQSAETVHGGTGHTEERRVLPPYLNGGYFGGEQ